MSNRLLVCLLIALVAYTPLVFVVPQVAHAETTECQEIRRLPTVINRGGVWCLKRDLFYPSKTGAAIEIRRNNVVLDLNGYKILGNAALDTQAEGIRMERRKFIRITNGNIERFRVGVHAVSGFGLRLDHLTLDQNRHYGILTSAKPTNTIIEHNVVSRSGRSTNPLPPFPGFDQIVAGIFTSAQRPSGVGVRISRNDVSIITPQSAGIQTLGIFVVEERATVEENFVHGTDLSFGIYLVNNLSVVRGNTVEGAADSRSGIRTPGVRRDNTVLGFSTPYSAGLDGGGNYP